MSNEQRATHARVIRLKTEPSNSDTAIKQWTSEVLPLLKKQDGFRGATLVGNRKTGDGLSVTYWASEEAMKNARPKVRPQAETIMGQAGSKIVDEDECEVAVQEERLAFTANSPREYVDAESANHPLAVASRAVLERRGEDQAVRDSMLSIYEAANEDPDGFRVTSRYVVAAARHR